MSSYIGDLMKKYQSCVGIAHFMLLQIHSHPSVIHLLLDNGADVNLLDDYGISALNACYHVLYANVPQVYSTVRCQVS